MSLVVNCVTFSVVWNSRKPCIYQFPRTSQGVYANPSFKGHNVERRRKNAVRAFFFNPTDEPILREALKEPVAFLGGVFAGVLRLDLNEDPLKEWLARTAEASGLAEEDIIFAGSSQQGEAEEEDGPLQIEIE